MKDPVLDLLRRILIDKALDQGDWELLKRLSRDGWETFVVSRRDNDEDLFWFLEQDQHFFEKRMVDWMGKKTYWNYRFRDDIDGVAYVGEIRVPMFGASDIESKFYPRRASEKEHSIPSWFRKLTERAEQIVYAGQGRAGM